MSVVTSVRDYIEILNTHISIGEDLSIFETITKTFPQFFQACKDALWYILTFKGLRENFYQPYLGSINHGSITLLVDNFSGSSGKNFVFRFFFYGLGNSFFISLPGSIGTLLVFRRIIAQGVPAGIAATLGSVLGTCWITVFVTFGSRFLFFSPTFLDLLFYSGFFIWSSIIVKGLCFSDFRILSLNDRKALFSIGGLHFFLGMCNQSSLFKHLRDLTINSSPTRFLGLSGYSRPVFYTLGFTLGSFLFSFILFFGFVALINWWLNYSTITRSRLMKLSENFSIVILTGLTVSTFSYYGTDFLLTKALGFLPSDKSFSGTVLAPTSLFKDPHNLTGIHALYPTNEFSLDSATFDRPLEKSFRRSILLKQPFFKYRSFEELNYQGEKHWLHKGFRHGSAKPIKTSTLPIEKNKVSEGRALLRSLDKAVGWVTDSKLKKAQQGFTILAKEDFLDFESLLLKKSKGENVSDGGFTQGGFLEQKFKRLFFGQIGLLPGRLPTTPYGPLDSQEMAHKRLAFSNPVYKTLLSFDIDLFLNRQPAHQFLTSTDEHNIFLKRQLLERYINTQRKYFEGREVFLTSEKLSKGLDQPVQTTPAQTGWRSQDLFNLSRFLVSPQNSSENSSLSVKPSEVFIKSLANQTYKHQFKGTLEIVRQMFAVSLDCPQSSSLAGGGDWDKALNIGGVNKDSFNDDRGLVIGRPTNPRILKFDQPLYIKKKRQTSPFSQNNPSSLLQDRKAHGYFNSQKLENLDLFTHEELSEGFNKTDFTSLPLQKKQKPFLESISIAPLYLSWDNQRHQLLLTQRYLSRKDALIFKPEGVCSLNLSGESGTKNENLHLFMKKEKSKGSKENLQYSSFATWPLIQPDFTDKPKANWRIPSRSFEQTVAVEDDTARIGLDDPNEKNKGLRGSYETFVELWDKTISNEIPGQTTSFRVTRWPINITTPAVQADLDSFDQIEDSIFTGVKRGGFVWPGGTNLNFSLLSKN